MRYKYALIKFEHAVIYYFLITDSQSSQTGAQPLDLLARYEGTSKLVMIEWNGELHFDRRNLLLEAFLVAKSHLPMHNYVWCSIEE